MDFKENKKYQLEILLKIRNDDHSKTVAEETLFGLIRIAQYSNRGITLFKCIIITQLYCDY